MRAQSPEMFEELSCRSSSLGSQLIQFDGEQLNGPSHAWRESESPFYVEPEWRQKCDVLDIIIAGKSDDVKGHERSLGRNNYGKDVRKVLQGEWRARHCRVSP
jgi:hypothetical protein